MSKTKWFTEHISGVEMSPGIWHVANHETGERFDMTKDELARFLSANVSSSRHVPLGDYVARGTKALGIETCLPCAERQAWLNRLIPNGRK